MGYYSKSNEKMSTHAHARVGVEIDAAGAHAVFLGPAEVSAAVVDEPEALGYERREDVSRRDEDSDEDGKQLQAIRAFLFEHPEIKWVWFECASWVANSGLGLYLPR